MKDECIIDGVSCPKQPKFYYMWEWGEDGVCCEDHRGVLQTRSGQLSRTINFSSLGRESAPRADYTPPKLQSLAGDDPKVLKAKIAEEMEQRKKLEAQISKLEAERETNAGKMREQELRIQDLLKTNAELKAAVATAELEKTAALELATSPNTADAKGETTTVIEGAPDTQTTKRRR